MKLYISPQQTRGLRNGMSVNAVGHNPGIRGGEFRPAIPQPPPPGGNGRSPAADGPSPTERLSFRFTRYFLGTIVTVVAGLIAGIAVLSTCVWMDVTVTGRGVVEPADRREAKAAWSGVIAKIHVTQWDRVWEGDPLATLDDTELRTEIEALDKELEINRSRAAEIRAQVARERDILLAEIRRARLEREAQAIRLEQIRREYELHNALSPPAEGRSRPKVENLLPVRLRRSALHRVDADVEQAQRRLAGLEARKQEIATLNVLYEKLEADRGHRIERLGRTVVRAPISGVVLTGDLRQRIGDRLQPGDPLLEIGEPESWRAKVSVSEVDIPKVEVGHAVRMAVEAFPHMEYRMLEGTVSEIPATPSPNSGDVSAYSVKVAMDDPTVSDGERTYALSYGMTLEARIVVERGTVLDIAWKRLLRAAGKVLPQDLHLN